MTQASGFIPPTANEGALGVHSVDHFTLQVPDLAAAQHFYTKFGLAPRENAGGLDLYTVDHPHRWGRVVEGSGLKRLDYVSFGAYAHDMPRFAARLQELGIPRRDPPPGVASNGLWFHAPDGTLLEIRVAAKSSPDSKSVVDNSSIGPGTRAMPPRSAAQLVRPRRLSHILLFTPDVPAMIAFYERVLGVRLSDAAGDVVAFMHGIHGSDHHMIAFAKSDGPGLHHCSWDMESTHAVGMGAMQMADAGYQRGWGMGRHVLGSNFFHYVRDPWGSYSEYSSDIDYVPAGGDWRSGHYSPEDGFYLWGPTPPQDFVTNFETGI